MLLPLGDGFTLLQREGEFELQAVCLLANDDVKERMQWPLDVYLTANDHTLSVVKRSTVKSVTKSARDPAVRIPASRLRSGSNHFRMFHRDRRGAFMIALRIVRKRSLDEVVVHSCSVVRRAVGLKHAQMFRTLQDGRRYHHGGHRRRVAPMSHQWTRVRTTGAIVRVRRFTHRPQSFLRLNTVSRK